MIIYAAIYRLAIYAYAAAIRIAALFNPKAKLFADGRKGLLQQIHNTLWDDNRPRIWMHCASLGEFEQGRPVLEELHRQYSGCCIVVTFFSPSGYEVRKDYKGADHVFYLPEDSPAHAAAFLDAVQPALCLFIKYEFWYYYLTAIAARKIPAILISAIFNKDQGFFKWYGGLQRRMLQCFTHIFVQDLPSLELLKTIDIANVSVSGDTRFDRVIQATTQQITLPAAAAFTQNHKVLVAGSTWKEDEELLKKALPMLPASWKLILVPHEVNDSHISEIEHLFGSDMVRWSQLPANPTSIKERVLLVDKVGFLLQLYRYSTVAWIGGGFGKDGVHNVLEAAVYGIPCFYGPIYHQFIEAQELINKNGGFTSSSPADLAASLKELDDSARYTQHAEAARDYVYSKAGATQIVLNYLQQLNIAALK